MPARSSVVSPTPEAAPPAVDFDRGLGAAVAARIGETRFNLWFGGHARFANLGGSVVVATRNEACRNWLEGSFGEDVKAAVREMCGEATPIQWAVDAALFEPVAPIAEPRETKPEAPPQRDLFGDPVPTAKPRAKRASVDAGSTTQRRPARRWKSLSDFVVGSCNRVAFASAQSIIEEPGQGANPLVLHGPVGTGKTHLLEGIFAGLRRQPDSHPVYVTAEEFTTRFVQASRVGKMSSFRRQFRDCTTLLLDNLNFLANKRGSLEEFLHTFDALIADGRQVVVTMDCHPRFADELLPELVDRLVGGAVWSLMPPDPQTRLAILRNKAGLLLPVIPDPVLEYLGTSLHGNVRELEGAVHGVRHFARVTGRAVDRAVAREALGDLLRHAIRPITMADVDAAVCTVLRLHRGTLQSKGRSWAVSHPRMAAIFLCRKHTAATYGEISQHFGAKTHSSAVAAEKKVRAWKEQDAKVVIGDREWNTNELLERIERELQR